MEKELRDLYGKRHGKYIKNQKDEEFLQDLNENLQKIETKQYKDYPVKYPFLFIFGLPRSGTTLITQLIANSFDIGFINNFMARFYLAPIHGIKLSRIIFGEEKNTIFNSDYARTSEITDIHEFGYFWRYWLKKENYSGVTRAREIENTIDWAGLKLVLSNMQYQFDKPMVFKNIYASYHIERMNQTLEKVIYIYIRRDILDSAISILEARRKYYKDLNAWWSYIPYEYDKIKDLDYWHQIAGQVYFLRRYYDQVSTLYPNIITIDYEELTSSTFSVLKKINQLSEKLYNYQIPVDISPPVSFPFRTYRNHHEEKNRFLSLIEKFAKENN